MNLNKLFRPKKLAIIGGYWADFVYDENIKIGFKGEIIFDPSKPDGTTRKLLDSKLINSLGFKPKVNLKEGLIKTYKEYIKA